MYKYTSIHTITDYSITIYKLIYYATAKSSKDCASFTFRPAYHNCWFSSKSFATCGNACNEWRDSRGLRR